MKTKTIGEQIIENKKEIRNVKEQIKMLHSRLELLKYSARILKKQNQPLT